MVRLTRSGVLLQTLSTLLDMAQGRAVSARLMADSESLAAKEALVASFPVLSEQQDWSARGLVRRRFERAAIRVARLG
jgi:hypothetical protein